MSTFAPVAMRARIRARAASLSSPNHFRKSALSELSQRASRFSAQPRTWSDRIFAAFREHVSVYPVTSGMVARYGNAIAPYRSGKGTLRFPLDAPIPAALVTRLAKVRVRERRDAARGT